MLDLHAMNSHGVLLGWQGGVNKRSVSELVISFSISLLHRAIFANNEVKSGRWYQIKGSQLSNKKFGIAYPIAITVEEVMSNLLPSLIALRMPKGIEIK